MATIIKSELATRPNRRFGINHQYITKKLTPYNYRWYAVVRDSCYLYVTKIKKAEHGKKTIEYRTYGWCWRDGREWILDYPDIHWALDDLNSLCDGEEGIYPPEFEGLWIIVTIPEIKEDKKPWAYQFTGFRNDEEK